MNKKKMIHKFTENLVIEEFQDKKLLIEKAIEKYTEIEKNQIQVFNESKYALTSLIKKNAKYATIIDFSGFIFNEEGENVVYTSHVVVKRTHLKKALDNTCSFKKNINVLFNAQKSTIIKVERNKRSAMEVYSMNNDIHIYGVCQYKEFFNRNFLNLIDSRRKEGCRTIVIFEGVGLPLLKVIFKNFGIVISSGKNNLKGTLSPTQFNLSLFMLSLFSTSAYKTVTQSFYEIDKFVNKPFLDLTEQSLNLFIKTIVLDEKNVLNFIHPSFSKYKTLTGEKNKMTVEKDIENVNKFLKENNSGIGGFNNMNNTKFKGVQSKRGIHTSSNRSTNKWLINSNHNNLVFDNNRVMLPPTFALSQIRTPAPLTKETKREYYSLVDNSIQQKRSAHTLINSDYKPSFNVYDNIKYFLIKNKAINHETQIEIEKYLLQHATSEFQINKDISGIHINVFSEKTTEFLLEYKPILLEKITKLLKNKKLYSGEVKSTEGLYYLSIIIDKIKPNFILKLLFGRYIKILSFDKFHLNPEKNLSNIIMSDLGNDLIREYFYKLYKETLKNKLENNNIKSYSYSDWKSENISLFTLLNQTTLKIAMGAILIEWLEDSGLITKNYIKIEKKLYGIITPPSELSEKWKTLLPQEVLISNQNISSKPIIQLTAPIRLPCIVPPKLFIKKEDGKYRLGGYWLNDEMFADDLILENHILKEKSVIKSDNTIYDLVNSVNSVSYKINIEVLKFIRQNPHLYKPELIENIDHPLSKLTKLSKNQKKEIQRYYSKLELQQHILNIADLYSNVAEFYFVNRIDFRGRLNCVTEYLNYQSTELAKSLLLFSKPSIVNRNNTMGVNYLKIFGANCFGNKIDKSSANNKIDWVNKNIDQILNFHNGELISIADNKFLFTAFCGEFKRWWTFYYDSTENHFNSYLPVQLDASCNGFQHLVLLSGEDKLRGELNLSSTDFSNKPGDFYSYVLGCLHNYFNNSFKNKLDDEKKACYIRLSKFCTERSIVKKMIMTLPYNATNYKIVEDLREILIESKENASKEKINDNVKIWLFYEKNKESKVNMKDLYILVDIIRKIIDDEAPKVAKLKKYLTKVAECCTQLQLHIPWLLPSGLEVRQSYVESTKVQIKPFTYSDTSISLQMRTNKIDGGKQARSFMPNLIHSLDSSSLTILLNNYFNNSTFDVKNIYTIHDCFAMPMSHVEFIIDCLRNVYISIYSDPNYLKRLNKGILDHIKNHYGDCEYIEEKNLLIVKINGIPKNIEFPSIKFVLGETLTSPMLDNNLKYILV